MFETHELINYKNSTFFFFFQNIIYFNFTIFHSSLCLLNHSISTIIWAHFQISSMWKWECQHGSGANLAVKDYLFASISTVLHSNNFKSPQWLNQMNCRQVQKSGNDEVEISESRQNSAQKATMITTQQYTFFYL